MARAGDRCPAQPGAAILRESLWDAVVEAYASLGEAEGVRAIAAAPGRKAEAACLGRGRCPRHGARTAAHAPFALRRLPEGRDPGRLRGHRRRQRLGPAGRSRPSRLASRPLPADPDRPGAAVAGRGGQSRHRRGQGGRDRRHDRRGADGDAGPPPHRPHRSGCRRHPGDHHARLVSRGGLPALCRRRRLRPGARGCTPREDRLAEGRLPAVRDRHARRVVVGRVVPAGRRVERAVLEAARLEGARRHGRALRPAGRRPRQPRHLQPRP